MEKELLCVKKNACMRVEKLKFMDNTSIDKEKRNMPKITEKYVIL